MKLNVGSGFRPLPGFENCDINPQCPVDFVCPQDDIPKPDNTYDELWSVHTIEHVPIPAARECLTEWHRVLKVGGIAHIDTPNIERNTRMYNDGTWINDFRSLTMSEQAMCSLDGKPNRTLWLNFKCFSSHHEYDVHFWNADPELLQALCKEAGFSEVRVVQTEPSLIVEAVK